MFPGSTRATSSSARSNSATASRGEPAAAYARPSVEKTSGRDAAVTSSDPTSPDSCSIVPAMISARRRLEPEHDPGARRRRDVGRPVGILEQLAYRFRIRLAVEPQPQLLVGEPQLAQLGRVELGARLEVLGRDAELLRQHPERLHRRRPRPGLDPGDVRVRDPGRREVPLGLPALDPQAAKPGTDRLATRVPTLRHRVIVPAPFDNVNQGMPQGDRIDNKRILRSPPGMGSRVRRGRRC